MARYQLLGSARHMALLAAARASALVGPTPVHAAYDDRISKGREVGPQHLRNELYLRREGDHGDVEGCCVCTFNKVAEDWADVGGQLRSEPAPSSPGVDVDDCLVKVDGKEVDIDCARVPCPHI